MQDIKGKVKKEVENIKFRSIVWNTDNCNIYPNSLSMFCEGSLSFFRALFI